MTVIQRNMAAFIKPIRIQNHIQKEVRDLRWKWAYRTRLIRPILRLHTFPCLQFVQDSNHDLVIVDNLGSTENFRLLIAELSSVLLSKRLRTAYESFSIRIETHKTTVSQRLQGRLSGCKSTVEQIDYPSDRFMKPVNKVLNLTDIVLFHTNEATVSGLLPFKVMNTFSGLLTRGISSVSFVYHVVRSSHDIAHPHTTSLLSKSAQSIHEH